MLPSIIVKHAGVSTDLVGMFSVKCSVKSRLNLLAMAGLVPSTETFFCSYGAAECQMHSSLRRGSE